MYKLFAILLTFVMLFTACATPAGTPTGAAADGQSSDVIFAVPDEIQAIDMHQITFANLMHSLTYVPLVNMDPTNTYPVPSIASDIYVSADGKTMIFTIPEGLYFSDGAAVTPEAIVASYIRYIDVSIFGNDFDPVDVIEAVDNTVVFHLGESAPFLWAVMVSVYSGVNNVGATNLTDDLDAVSFGPYYVESWVPGQHVILRRNEGFRSYDPTVTNHGPAFPERITVRFISDDFTRVNELLSGNVDFISSVPAANLAELQAAPNIRIAQTYQAGCSFMTLNTHDPILSDHNVRLAIARAVNRAEISAAQDNTIVPAYGFINHAMIGFSETSQQEMNTLWAHDLNEANALLDASGWTDRDGDIRVRNGERLSLELLIANDHSAQRNAGPLIQHQLRQIGIEARITELLTPAIRDNVRAGDYQMAVRRFSWADADMLINLFHTDSGFYSNPAIDPLLEQARSIVDGAERAAAYGEVQRMLFDSLPAVPLFYEIMFSAHLDTLDGVAFSSTGNFMINDVFNRR